MARRERESWWQWLKRKLTRRPRLEWSTIPIPHPIPPIPPMIPEEEPTYTLQRISAKKSEVKVLPSTSDEDYYDVNVSTEAHEESSVTHYSNPSFDCLFEKSVQVTNKEQHIVWEGYGLTLHISSNSLPVNCSSFELKIEVGMSGEFELPEDNGTLVSAVYSFKHNLEDKELCQPITLGMQHCALPSALKYLSIIRASAGSKKFVVIPDGDFTTTSGYGEIKLLKVSNFAIVFLRRHFPIFFSPFEYCCQVYTTAITCTQFNFEVCIFRNLQVLSKVIEDQIKRRDKQYESTGPPAEIQFQERVIRLEVPEGSYGDGWIMGFNTPEIDRNKVDHYTDQKVFIPCVVKVEWNGDRETGPTKFSYKIKFKGAVEGFNVIDVKSPRSVTKGFLHPKNQHATDGGTISQSTNHGSERISPPSDIMLDIDRDVGRVQKHLKPLENVQLKQLFEELGLSDSTLRNKYSHSVQAYADDLIRAWILGRDNVLTSEEYQGGPTMDNLKKALTALGHNGIVSKMYFCI